MNDAFNDFRWSVAPRYEWQDWVDKRGKPIAVPKEGLISLESASAVEGAWNRSRKQKREYGPVLCPVMNDPSELRHYRPMERQHAALFREFCSIDYTSLAAVMEFARKYGGLGVPMQAQSVLFHDADGTLHNHHAYGEPFLQWALEICLMQEGLRLASRKRSFESSRRLKWLFDRNLQHVQGRLAFSLSGEAKLVLEPLTLVSAMWLQLALAVTGDKRFVACKFCHRMFEISTEQTGFRSHREFCRDSCKTKDYRKRKRTALRLAGSGVGVREISEKTATEVATVRSWLAVARHGVRSTSLGGR